MRLLFLLIVAIGAVSCGYHVSGRGDMMPKSVKTIAIPAWGNATARYRLTDTIPEAVAREIIQRTRYRIVQDIGQADVILRGTIVNVNAYPVVLDPANSRASVVQVSVVLSATLYDREGKQIFSRQGFEMKQQYEISSDQRAFFEESGPALDRLSRDVARMVVSAILENF